MQFLAEIMNIRDDVFSLQFSAGLTLSRHELNAIVLYLATDRQTSIFVFVYIFHFNLVYCCVRFLFLNK